MSEIFLQNHISGGFLRVCRSKMQFLKGNFSDIFMALNIHNHIYY